MSEASTKSFAPRKRTPSIGWKIIHLRGYKRMATLGGTLCNNGEFAGKVAIVTGGGRGIGKALSRALAIRGAAVGILGTTEATVKALADELTDEGLRAVSLTCDVADEAAVDGAVATVEDLFGGVDILINNAGLTSPEYSTKGFGELGLAASRRLFEVNVMGVVICSLACQQAMTRRGGGVVLNISSITASLCSNAYGVSKLAVNGLTVSLATELAKYNIRVNGIAPGMTVTDEIRKEFDPKELEAHTQYMTNKQLIQRIGSADDVVNAMLYLCSDWAAHVTGETLRVSAGYPLGF
jgi:NAD(P)-dependent dehydrogenase (short-subunit alcohol dehydrogenase family)